VGAERHLPPTKHRQVMGELKEAFGVTIFQPAVATQKKKPIHTLRRLTEYTTYYEISLEEGKKKKMIKKRSECFLCVQK